MNVLHPTSPLFPYTTLFRSPSCSGAANALDQVPDIQRGKAMLRDDINNAVKDAMKAKDERKLSTLRMVNSTIKNADIDARDRKSTRLNSSHQIISYAVFCLK